MLKDKNFIEKKRNFLYNLEGLGDILVFETKRKWNKEVSAGLRKIGKIGEELFLLKKKNLERFERILLDQDLLKLFEDNKREAELQLVFNPKKSLIGFYAILNPIIKIHSAAMDTKNEEISKSSVYQIIFLLNEVSLEKENDLFVEQILRELAEISKKATEAQDASMYSSSIHWYGDIVFNKLTNKRKDFCLEYLPKFNRYFFYSATSIISRDDTPLFISLISYLIEGILLPVDGKGKIWDYGHLISNDNIQEYVILDKKLGLESNIKALESQVDDINTVKKLDEWKARFSQLKENVVSNIKLSQKKEAKELEDKIIDYASSRYKFNSLLELIFLLGAYCWSKKKGSYIKIIWEFKQPPDADAHWIGHDIVHTDIDKIISFYFGTDFSFGALAFSENHHGSEKYFKEYFLLRLAKILEPVSRDIQDGGYSKIQNFVIPDMNIYQLSDIDHSVPELISLSNGLKNDVGLLGEMGFDSNKIEETFSNKLIPFLEQLRLKAQRRVVDLQVKSDISEKKVKEFEDEVLESFKKNAVIRGVLKYFKLIKDQSDISYTGSVERLGINKLEEKSVFFDEWNISFPEWGSNYGADLSTGEDGYFSKKISEKCQRKKIQDIKEALDQITKDNSNSSDLFILSSLEAFYKFFSYNNNYKSRWQSEKRPLDLPGFIGWYDYENVSIPVFEVREIEDKGCLILNKRKFGYLLQLNPLEKNESPKLKKDILFINIESFSSDNDLLKEMLNKPPEWLKQIGDVNQQTQYLLTKARVRISERIELNLSEDFTGMLIEI